MRRLLLTASFAACLAMPAFAQDVSDLLVRLNRLESQVRQLSGQNEQLQFENKRLSEQLTILAIVEGEPVGFGSLRGKDELDLLYVHPDVVRNGVGSMLVDALEKLAGARGATAMLTNSSETARPFFEKRGYLAQSRNTTNIGDEWLVNIAMRKELGGQKGTLQ